MRSSVEEQRESGLLQSTETFAKEMLSFGQLQGSFFEYLFLATLGYHQTMNYLLPIVRT